MRIVKEADERKTEILDAAERLFSEQGFDETSISDVLKAVGIARGTLYYHFDSKESIMDALIDRYNEQLIQSAGHIASDKTMPVYERIIKTIMALKIETAGGRDPAEEVMGYIHRPKNILMHSKIQKLIIKNITPMLSEIISDGIDQGLFSTPYPFESMEMILVYASVIFDDNTIELSQEDIAGRIQAFIFNAERILGAAPGSIPFSEELFSGAERAPEN